MPIEPAYAPARPPDDLPAVELGPPETSVDDNLVEAAADLVPGKALDLGCGSGNDAIWLASHGWTVTAVDPSAEALEEARQAASAVGVSLALQAADLTSWRPSSRFDLVVATGSLPARGMGRSRMLEAAVAAVAPGGTIVVSELDISLHRAGRMAEKLLVSVDELERYLDGFRIVRSGTRLVGHRHGFEEIVMPVAFAVAMRRTDLRTLY
jgi:2-polyprenyl-3-methyl-5-hydroxy-6-metoxy-1,4-benzoquinol methylase